MEPGEKGGTPAAPLETATHTLSLDATPRARPRDRTSRARPLCLHFKQNTLQAISWSHSLNHGLEGDSPAVTASGWGRVQVSPVWGARAGVQGAGCLQTLRPQAASQPREDLGADSTPGQFKEFTSTPRNTSSQGADTSWPHLQEMWSLPGWAGAHQSPWLSLVLLNTQEKPFCQSKGPPKTLA